jgi:rod shape-determining protein MreC
MKWIKEHKLFSVISGIVLVLCLVIIVSFLSAGGSSFIGRGTHEAVTILEKPLSAITSGVRNTVAGIFRYNSVVDENEKLKRKIEKLESENVELIMHKSELKQLNKLSKAFAYKPFKSKKNGVAASIIELDYSNPYLVFTVDAGTEKGIKKDDVVVDGEGLVGKVLDTGDGYSKIVSILSENNNVSFQVLRNSNIKGVLTASKKGDLRGYVMKNNARIVKGDTLVTSGVGIYPKGIVIGKVKNVEYDENKQLKMIVVKPAADFEVMDKVAIFK